MRILPMLCFTGIAVGQSIVNTAHNLSVTSSAAIKATNEAEICVFCHMPHNSSPRKPLWNREDPGMTYTPYSSSTIHSSPGQPDGSAVLCLSCHDGTIALGSAISRTDDIQFESGVTVVPLGGSNLGTDLSDDHPVSILYDASLAASNEELTDPAGLTGPVKLENERLQCTACHNPHKDLVGNFLTETNQYSTLCMECHQKNGWTNSEHNTSIATWDGTGRDPWPHTPYTTVNENACENCHRPHTASGHLRILNYFREEDNCLYCHNGSVAAADINADFNKTWKHNFSATTNVHDPVENLPVQVRHVECVDCHNPHYANGNTAAAPFANGQIQGVPGVDSDGNAVAEIQYEYELCYKCHADSPDKPGTNIPRQIVQTNVRLEFDPSNPSFHPVEAAGTNPDVPSLLPPYTESSIIYCTDCHASSGAGAAEGPHGSIYFHLLKYNYETADNTTESYAAYELCYQCHDRNSIINNTSTGYGDRVHNKHIVEENTPCSVCHDAHGISSGQGNSTNNSHLINFNTAVVSGARPGGQLEFIDNGDFAGECWLTCHGRNHRGRSYN